MFSLAESERRQKFDEDLVLLKRYDKGLKSVLDYAKSRSDLFPKDSEIALDLQQRTELREIFSAILDYIRAIDGVKNYWADFQKFGSILERRAHVEAFIASYFAWLVQYKYGLVFMDLTVPNITMEKILDENSSKHEIPEGAFKHLKWEVINVKSVARLMGAHQYFKTLRTSLRDFDCDKNVNCKWAVESVDPYHYGAKEALKERGVVQFSYNAFDIVRDLSFSAWFPVQKNVAEWMGDTKVARLHRNLISGKDLQKMETQMVPGDILVVRHNWYLSNIGLPGFWPHAELYLGKPSELNRAFEGPEISAYLNKTYQLDSFEEVLKQKYSLAWEAYQKREEGSDKVIIEAVSEGVKFSTLNEGAGADYVGVIRPKRTKLEKMIAILNAFSMHGLPYDFNFDFATDESLVCTELVYKAYQPTKNYRGLKLPTVEVMGRNTLPANDLITYYAGEGAKEFEFVYFLDGVEKTKSAVVSTESELKKSWTRPKWDVVQK